MADLLLVPPLAKDERSCLIAELAQRISDIDLTPLMVYLIDIVDASALPHLAEQFGVRDILPFFKTERQQRNLVRHAIRLKKHMGTPWAVEYVLQLLELDGRVTEWFEYDGRPHTFRVAVDVGDQGLDENTIAMLEKLVKKFKRASQALEKLSISLSGKGAIYIGAVALSGEAGAVYPYMITEVNPAPPRQHIGAAVHAYGTATVFPKGAC